jgi:hypothetical protein
MPTTNPEKNREYVKASNMKKKEQLIREKGQEEGLKEYKSYFAENQQKYRDNKKDTEDKAALYKKQQAEYMKQYRAKKKQEKQENEAGNTLIGAWKAHQARKAVREARAEQEAKVSTAKKGRGRGRPAGSKNKAK